MMEMSVRAPESFDIEEEYKNTLRRQSNARFFFLSKQARPEEEMGLFLDTQLHDDFASSLMLMRCSSEMELALADYFDASAEALEMCRQLLRNVKSTQSNYRSMDRFLAAMAAADGTASTATASSSSVSIAVADEEPSSSSFPVRMSNPFCTTTRGDFRQIHDRCSSTLQSIRSSHGRVARKLKIVKAVKKLSRTLLVIASVAAAAAAIGAGPHLLFLIGLLIGPAAAAGLCQIALKRPPLTATATATKGRSGGKTTTAALSLLQDQLDAAAKGVYVLGRDLDTLNRLVARVSDGIERENAMAWRCVDAASDRCPAAVLEMVSELRRSCSASGRLADELEEHVCLCLATIHKGRVLVIHEISKKP